MGSADSLDGALPHATHIVGLGSGDSLIDVVDFEECHVATIAATLVEQSTGSRALGDGGHDLDELVSHAEQGVVQAEVGYAWVAEHDIEVEGLRYLCDRIFQAVGNEGNLAQANHVCTIRRLEPLRAKAFPHPVDIHHSGCDISYIAGGRGLTRKRHLMYTLGSLILLSILLGAVMPVFHSVTSTLKIDGIIHKIPVVGAHITLAVSILLVWGLDLSIVSTMTGGMRESWMTICVDGCIVYGMIPVKDAIVSFISKGLTGLRAA